MPYKDLEKRKANGKARYLKNKEQGKFHNPDGTWKQAKN